VAVDAHGHGAAVYRATEDDEKIYGRGSCDAKGIIAAQIVAAEQLRSEGIEDIGLLYTVEEERARPVLRLRTIIR